MAIGGKFMAINGKERCHRWYISLAVITKLTNSILHYTKVWFVNKNCCKDIFRKWGWDRTQQI